MNKSLIIVIGLTWIASINMSCQSNQGIPEYIKEVVAYQEGPDGMVIYFILADKNGREISSDGRVELKVTSSCDCSTNSENMDLWLGNLVYNEVNQVIYRDFHKREVGRGAFKAERLLYSYGRIKFSNFSFEPYIRQEEKNTEEDTEEDTLGKALKIAGELYEIRYRIARRECMPDGMPLCGYNKTYSVSVNFYPSDGSPALYNSTKL